MGIKKKESKAKERVEHYAGAQKHWPGFLLVNGSELVKLAAFGLILYVNAQNLGAQAVKLLLRAVG